MHLTDISLVTIPPNRQRAEGKGSKDLEGLKKSILSQGLIHAPILTDSKELVAGERRVLAIKELYEDGLTFLYDGQQVPLGQLPFTRLLEATALSKLEVEYDENFWRLNLTWQEQSLAFLRIEELKKAQSPGITKTEINTQILQEQGKPVTPETLSAQQFKQNMMTTVAQNLHNPVVANAPNVSKAYKALLNSQARELERDLIRLNPAASPHTLIQGDFRTAAKDLEPGSFDAVITDPPYGINAHKAGDGAIGHKYDDSPTHALDLYRELFRLSWNLLKPMGTLFVFCDIEHFLTIRTFAEQQAFSTFRTPLVWAKGSEGHAPWGREGPKRTYEIALFAVKGQRSLVLPFGPDIISIPRATVDPNRVHAAEKPPELFRFLVQKSCRAGDRVLDPFCGAGSIFAAAQGLGIHVTGIELDPDTHNLAAARMARLLEGSEPTPDAGVSHPETITDIMLKVQAANDAGESA